MMPEEVEALEHVILVDPPAEGCLSEGVLTLAEVHSEVSSDSGARCGCAG